MILRFYIAVNTSAMSLGAISNIVKATQIHANNGKQLSHCITFIIKAKARCIFTNIAFVGLVSPRARLFMLMYFR